MTVGTETADKLPAADWLPFFIKAGVLAKALNDTGSARGKTIKIGQFLTPNVNRTVPIQIKGRGGRATLRVRVGTHAKEKLYFFEIVWDAPIPETGDAPGPKKATGIKKQEPPEKPPSETHTGKTEKSGNDEEWE